MPKIDETVIGFAVYEDATEYMGLSEVALPEISNITCHPTEHTAYAIEIIRHVRIGRVAGGFIPPRHITAHEI